MLIQGTNNEDYLSDTVDSDVILGGDGDDSLVSTNGTGADQDQLFGQGGDDYLLYFTPSSTSTSKVLLDGGGGNDEFRFNGTSTDKGTLAGGSGFDHLMVAGGSEVVIDSGTDADWIDISYYNKVQVTLGSGADLISIEREDIVSPLSPIVITDFTAGDAGDALRLTAFLVRQVFPQTYIDNPFAVGVLRLEQRGADAVLQVDRDADGTRYGFEDFVLFRDLSAASLTARNLGGYAPNGGATAGINLVGSADPDYINGTSGGDVIAGAGGNDALFGGAGDDRLEGGDGNDMLDGDFGNDLLLGGDGNDTLNDDQSGNDQLFGGEGSDNLSVDKQRFGTVDGMSILDGGNGNDGLRFIGGQRFSDATLIGGAGNDFFSVYLGRNITIDGGDGDDYVAIDLYSGSTLVTLGAGTDTLAPSRGFGGPEPLAGFTVTDFVAGDSGDKFYLWPLAYGVGHAWNPSINPFTQGILTVASSSAGAVLLFNQDPAGVQYVEFGHLSGTEAANLTAFNFDYDPGKIAIGGTSGAESLSGTTVSDLIFGFAGDDILRGGLGDDKLIGGDGDDFLVGDEGADTMAGGAGNDVYYVSDAGDVVVETTGQGFDRVSSSTSYALSSTSEVELVEITDLAGVAAINLTGSDTANSIYGNAGTNVISGAGGNDVLHGLGGDDILIGGSGNDTLFGGAGNDNYYVESRDDRVIEAAGQGYDRVVALTSHFLAEDAEIELLEAITLAATNSLDLNGSNFANTIYGNAGANVLRGLGGDDTLYGLAGDDILVGGAGQDAMYGGLGDDTYYVDSEGDRVFEYAGEGNDRLTTTVSVALPDYSAIEVIDATNLTSTNAMDLSGGDIANTISGNNGANILHGNGGDDTLRGYGGDDFLVGGAGADALWGGAGNDTYYVDNQNDAIFEFYGEGNADRVATSASLSLMVNCEVELLETINTTSNEALNLSGSGFANTIIGNAGANVLDGKDGNDRLVGLGGSDTFLFSTTVTSANIDRIEDFQPGVDTIALDDAVFTHFQPGSLDPAYFRLGTQPLDDNDFILYDRATGSLYYDADGNRPNAAMLFAVLTGAPNLTTSDFLIM